MYIEQTVWRLIMHLSDHHGRQCGFQLAKISHSNIRLKDADDYCSVGIMSSLIWKRNRPMQWLTVFIGLLIALCE